MWILRRWWHTHPYPKGRLKMLKIGAFARRASVSIKTLRFYDRTGIFRPARVDGASGYRYYEASQLDALRELRRLRELGFSIADLRAWMSSEAHTPRLGLLLNQRGRLERGLRRDLDRLRDLDSWIECLGRSPAVRSIPAIPALTMRERVRDMSPAVYRMFESLERKAARESARAPREPFLLLHDGDYREKNVDVEVCVPITPRSLSALGGRVVPGSPRAASLIFSGSYERAPMTYLELQKWLRLTGSQATGPLRETYLRFGADQQGYRLPERFLARDVAEYRTQLQVSLFSP
jgi:DNA-binding transcriptional MerR regulator